MTPAGLGAYLERLSDADLVLPVFVWGPPGVGKSSVVRRVAERRGGLIDLRVSQLRPSDLRGLPVPGDGVTRWLPPEFLPREGRGVLFLDELNLAPPAVQGVAQQLVLDQRVGEYALPPGWLVWAAGNRKEDRAGVFDMPAPLANRFLHLSVEADLASFRDYGLRTNLDERLLAFLAFRPELLHKPDPLRPAWPSPRSWEAAHRLLAANIDPGAAVGEAAAAEYRAFVQVYASLPDLDAVAEGRGADQPFPEEPSARYATMIGLAARAAGTERALHAYRWAVERGAKAEWVQLLMGGVLARLREAGEVGRFVVAAERDENLTRFLREYQEVLVA